jgi:MFS transporter, SP family, solute carrier family 2 (myo-inositol transporter), member 13
MADMQGRQRTLHLAAMLFVAGALIQAFAHSVWVMVVGRLVVGAAVGLSSGAAGVYVAEVAPAKWRGRLVVVTALGITAGQVIAYLVGWALGKEWRWMVGLGAVPAIAQMAGLAILGAESPRWLVSAKGDLDGAKKVLDRVYGGQQEMVERVLKGIKREVTGDGADLGLKKRFDELVGDQSNRKALVIACLLQGAQQICGFVSAPLTCS